MNIQDRICNSKIKGGCASICWKCAHFYVCFAKESQPCIECDQYISAEPPKQGRLIVLDRETALAIAAGWRAIRTTKRFQGASYVYDPLGEDGGPYEIPYSRAAEILCNIWDKYPLDREEADKEGE